MRQLNFKCDLNDPMCMRPNTSHSQVYFWPLVIAAASAVLSKQEVPRTLTKIQTQEKSPGLKRLVDNQQMGPPAELAGQTEPPVEQMGPPAELAGQTEPPASAGDGGGGGGVPWQTIISAVVNQAQQSGQQGQAPSLIAGGQKSSAVQKLLQSKKQTPSDKNSQMLNQGYAQMVNNLLGG